MDKSTKVTVLFIVIFLIGVLGFISSINYSLDASDDPKKVSSSK